MTSLFIVQEIHDICDQMMEEEAYRIDTPGCMLDIQNIDIDTLDALGDNDVSQNYILSLYTQFLDQLAADAAINHVEYNRLIDLYNDTLERACQLHDQEIVMGASLDPGLEPLYDPDDFESPFGDGPDPDDVFYQAGYGEDDGDVYGNRAELDKMEELPDVTATLCGKAFLMP